MKNGIFFVILGVYFVLNKELSFAVFETIHSAKMQKERDLKTFSELFKPLFRLFGFGYCARIYDSINRLYQAFAVSLAISLTFLPTVWKKVSMRSMSELASCSARCVYISWTILELDQPPSRMVVISDHPR